MKINGLLKLVVVVGVGWLPATMAFAQINQSLGLIPAGKSVTLTFDVTINKPLAFTVTHIAAQGTISGSNFAPVATDDPETPALNDPTLTDVTDQAPVAGAGSMARYPSQGVKILISDLLTNATDADGDILTLSGVSAATPAGATIALNGNWVFYAPPDGSTAAGSFDYTVTDPRGASSTGTMSVTIKNDTDPTPNIISITDLGLSGFQIVISGIPGRVYRIQVTDSLSLPISWTPLGSVTADALGRCVINDASGSVTRYYRSVYP